MQKGGGFIPLSSDRARVFLVQGRPTLKWSFPKGRHESDDGDDQFKTAIREAKEEAGITEKDYTLTDKTFTYNNYKFFEIIVNDSFVPKLQEKEVADGKWFTFEELKSIPLNIYVNIWYHKHSGIKPAAPVKLPKRSRIEFELKNDYEHITKTITTIHTLLESIQKKIAMTEKKLKMIAPS
jgi:8-oxo-dGTP pyrophosphatase MutT (NUDIX family)